MQNCIFYPGKNSDLPACPATHRHPLLGGGHGPLETARNPRGSLCHQSDPPRHKPAGLEAHFSIASKLVNNDTEFFKKFTTCRCKFEELLVANKQLIAAIIQQTRSGKRYETISGLFDFIIKELAAGTTPSEEQIIEKAGVTGKVIVGQEHGGVHKFSEDTKSATYLREALSAALRCPVCEGYLDPNKSVSYDHKTRVRDGGTGKEDNCQLTHPFCNQSVKQ